MYVKYSAQRQISPLQYISQFTRQKKGVRQYVLSSLSQWPYGNTFHCTQRHKSAANTTIKHHHTPNSSQTVTAINGTEPSWELQILLQPKPVDKCYTTASIIHSHRSLARVQTENEYHYTVPSRSHSALLVRLARVECWYYCIPVILGCSKQPTPLLKSGNVEGGWVGGCIVPLMPGFQNVRYLFYSDIEWLTDVLTLHERKIAHQFDNCLLTQRTVIEEISIL